MSVKEAKASAGKNDYYVGGYKLIGITVSDSTENLYAVVTPVKNRS